MKKLAVLAILFVFLGTGDAWATRGGGHQSRSPSHSSSSRRVYASHAGSHGHGYAKTHRASHQPRQFHLRSTHTRRYAVGVPRDSHGRIKRSEAARDKFMRMTGYPHGRPGYVIAHIVPLKRGGADDPSNMQWQTKAEGKAKDRRE